MKTNVLLVTRLLNNIFNHSRIVKRYLYDVNKLRKVNGLPFTIKYMKAVKLHCTRYMCGQPLLINSSLVSLTQSGFPTKFLYLKELMSSKDGKRLLLSLLSYTRALKPLKKEIPMVDYSSITLPYKGKEYTIPNFYIDKFIKDNFKKNTYKIQYGPSIHYISNKSSPFGKATLHGLYGLFYMINVSSSLITTMCNMVGPIMEKSLILETLEVI
jgi:hypothetical protein